VKRILVAALVITQAPRLGACTVGQKQRDPRRACNNASSSSTSPTDGETGEDDNERARSSGEAQMRQCHGIRWAAQAFEIRGIVIHVAPPRHDNSSPYQLTPLSLSQSSVSAHRCDTVVKRPLLNQVLGRRGLGVGTVLQVRGPAPLDGEQILGILQLGVERLELLDLAPILTRAVGQDTPYDERHSA